MNTGSVTTDGQGKASGGAGSAGPVIRDAIKAAGIRVIATLPDSWLTDVITSLDEDREITLVRVCREDEAVGICAGAFLGGVKAAVLAQNGGFLLSVNALAGLGLHHQIPILMLLAHRGGVDDDQYFQSYKGRVTEPALDALRIPHHRLERLSDAGLIADAYRQAWLARSPVAILMTAALLRQGAR
jgi:sulfopyruvate decarboxylase subunit alpha